MKIEIKFRAWDYLTKSMVYDFDGYYFDHQDSLFLGYDDINGDCQELELMQFTGLKDKNGKEIYENDIIKIKDFFIDKLEYDFPNDNPKETYQDLISKIYFTDGAFCFNYSDDENESIPLFGFDNCEIIGNIFENPELIS